MEINKLSHQFHDKKEPPGITRNIIINCYHVIGLYFNLNYPGPLPVGQVNVLSTPIEVSLCYRWKLLPISYGPLSFNGSLGTNVIT
jgi:hypothetical protein